MSSTLPRWDMSVVYPSLRSPEFESAFQQVIQGIDRLERRFDQELVGKRSEHLISEGFIESFDSILGEYNELLAHIRTVGAYISAFVTTDSRDELALAKDSESDIQYSRLSKLSKRLTAWVGSSDTDALIERSAVAAQHEFYLRKAEKAAQHLMEPNQESLVSDLELSGSNAWGKLHSNVTSQLIVPIDICDEAQALPMSAVRALAYDIDRDKRRTAYEAELTAWRGVEIPLAAAMNGIKGEVLTLSQYRNWESPLDEALFGTNIDRAALDAMFAAAQESFPIFRRYLKAKAKALGLSVMSWYDIFAPIGEDTEQWSFQEAAEFVVEKFGCYSARLSKYAARTVRDQWIDAEPREGKQDGAFCMGLRGDESRILMNFKPSFGSVSTLAHELGHGYHNVCLAERTPLQRSTPMTLAETASIFCETIIRRAAMASGSKQQQLAILEASLQGSCQVVVDISSRYIFETTVFGRRGKRELSAREMCEIMSNAQHDTYGDGLDPQVLHPYMWAAKSHYYGRSFYNFPYMFGLLFGLGLYAIYEQDPGGFQSRYDELLSSTGLFDAATLAGRFGIDIRSIDFWRASLGQIAQDVDSFENLIK